MLHDTITFLRRKASLPLFFSNLCGMESLHIGKSTKQARKHVSDFSNTTVYEQKLN